MQLEVVADPTDRHLIPASPWTIEYEQRLIIDHLDQPVQPVSTVDLLWRGRQGGSKPFPERQRKPHVLALHRHEQPLHPLTDGEPGLHDRPIAGEPLHGLTDLALFVGIRQLGLYGTARATAAQGIHR
jgi:hypothetical protein